MTAISVKEAAQYTAWGEDSVREDRASGQPLNKYLCGREPIFNVLS